MAQSNQDQENFYNPTALKRYSVRGSSKFICERGVNRYMTLSKGFLP